MNQSNEVDSSLTSTMDKVQLKVATKSVHTATERVAPLMYDFVQKRHHLISEAAYYRALARDFTPGGEMEDWIQAEAEIDHVLHHE